MAVGSTFIHVVCGVAKEARRAFHVRMWPPLNCTSTSTADGWLDDDDDDDWAASISDVGEVTAAASENICNGRWTEKGERGVDE